MLRRVLLLIMLAVAALAQKPERYRPLVHFSPDRNWTNDPCGLVFYRGEYHLFFQYNPFGDQWGHMSWGHAVSRDLLRWQQLPVALREEDGVMMFTGSSVVDERNTSGLCRGSGCVVSVYTGHEAQRKRQHQNLAASDDGRAWRKYERNPVLDEGLADFRDPKVFWHEPSRRWVMVLAVPPEHKVRFYGSPDLKAWARLGEFGPAGATGGDWECPDLYELPVEGERGSSRWVLKVGLNPGHLYGGSGEQYFIGTFDGKTFRNENRAEQTLWLDYGRDCYCALTFNGTPRGQAPVMIGWLNNWQYAKATPTTPWRGAMTLPRRLSLRRFADGLRLVQQPVEDVSGRRGARSEASTSSAPDAYDLEATVEPGTAQRFGWKIWEGADQETVVGYDKAHGEVFVDRTRSGAVGFSERFPSRTAAPLDLAGQPLRVRIVVDRSSIEVFAGGGRVTLTNLVFPQDTGRGLEFFAEGGKVQRVQAVLYPLR